MARKGGKDRGLKLRDGVWYVRITVNGRERMFNTAGGWW